VPAEESAIRVTNTGSTTETFVLSVDGLPAGIATAFSQSSVSVPPGIGNFREVTFSLTPAVATAAGNIPFILTVTSNGSSATDTAAGTLVVTARGVSVALDRATGAPGESFTAIVTNTGNASDTFDLSVTGPAGLVATLGSSLVTLGAGQSQNITVTTASASFAVQGQLSLMVLARSRSDTAVADTASANLAITATVGLVTRFDPDAKSLQLPGTEDFLLFVENTGNTEDAYVASITGTTGSLGASLIGLDGLPAQSVPTFRLPGLSQGAILVRANANAGLGSVTVQVQSLNNPSLTVNATATLNVAEPVLVGYREFGVGAGAGFAANARFFNPNASERYARNVFPGLSGGVRVTSADFNGDGIADLVAGTGPGSITRVVVFDGTTGNSIFSIQPFEDRFVGGVFVAAGDITGDGIPDLVISPDESGGPRVSIFSGAGFGRIADFFGIDDPDFRGGARAAVGDVNGDGVGDVVVSAGFGGGPRIAVFDGAELTLGRETRLMPDYFHFEETLRNGAYVAVGDINGDGYADLIGGGGPGGGPRVFALSGKDLLTLSPTQSEVVANFFGGDVNNRGGIRVVARDLDGDLRADLVVGDGAGAGSRVTGYLGKDIQPTDTPAEAFAFDAYPGFTGGVFVG